jgi:hypothetical protein
MKETEKKEQFSDKHGLLSYNFRINGQEWSTGLPNFSFKIAFNASKVANILFK